MTESGRNLAKSVVFRGYFMDNLNDRRIQADNAA